ncbi:MAG: hypothetical protein IJ561_04735 [Ruminococcus sp.]|nr:hypothetical protein [Ruminococcus sp.]
MSFIEEMLTLIGSETLESKRVARWVKYLLLGVAGIFLAVIFAGALTAAAARGDILALIAGALAAAATAMIYRLAFKKIKAGK